MSNRLPVTVLTGFLGAGKTTLLRHLLVHGKQRLAVVVNEFGSVGLDGDLIRSCGFCPEDEIEGRLVELNNGCLCCTVQDDFLPTMNSLLERAQNLDGIIVETSGLALPRPLLQALDWPAIRTKVHINGVITIVDGEALSSGSPVGDITALEKQRDADPSLDHLTPLNELFEDQLSAADIVLISRCDLISDSSLKKLEKDLLKQVNHSIPILPISHGQIDPEVILGLNFSDRAKEISDDMSTLHHHNESHHHLDALSSSIRFEASIDENSLKSFLPTLAARYFVLRLKGRCWLPGKVMPLQIQMVGDRLTCWFESAPLNAWHPTNGGLDLVVMGFKDQPLKGIEQEIQQNCCL